jgi:hypothetical protein
MLALLCLTGGSLNGSIGLCFLLNSGILVLCRYNDKPFGIQEWEFKQFEILYTTVEYRRASKQQKSTGRESFEINLTQNMLH